MNSEMIAKLKKYCEDNGIETFSVKVEMKHQKELEEFLDKIKEAHHQASFSSQRFNT